MGIAQFLRRARRLQRMEEACCFLPRDGLQVNLENLLSMKISYSSKDFLSETMVVETIRKHLSTNAMYTFADVVEAQAKKTFD